MRTPLPSPTLTFAIGIVILAVAVGLRHRDLETRATALRAESVYLADAAATVEDLQAIALRRLSGRTKTAETHAALSARLQESAANPYLANSPAARRMAEILSGPSLGTGEFLQLIGRVQRHLHDAEAERQRRALALAAAARQDLAVLGGLLALLAIAYAVSSWRQGRQVARLAATSREIRSGKLGVRAPTDGSGPAAELAVDFNEMVEILVDSLAQEGANVAELERRADALAAANRHKSRFMANVSHELKTPLGAIVGLADVLQSGLHGPLTDKQRDYLQRIAGAGAHLQTMISDLIDTARIDADVLQLNPEDCDAVVLVREVAAMMESAAANASVTIEVTAKTSAPIHQDPARVRQILINLTANAVKFSPKGGRIAITVAAGNAWISIAVEDQGPGVPETDRERIFEDFVQLDDALGRKHEGSGMGLAISRRLAKLMGGNVTCATPTSPLGARFLLDLPIKPQAPTP